MSREIISLPESPDTILYRWTLTSDQVRLLDFYKTGYFKYWGLMDNLIENRGLLRYEGQNYKVKLLGKQMKGVQVPGNKHGLFRVSYRAIGQNRVALVREDFDCSAGASYGLQKP